jgi:lysophospholipase L1-like esterase
MTRVSSRRAFVAAIASTALACSSGSRSPSIGVTSADEYAHWRASHPEAPPEVPLSSMRGSNDIARASDSPSPEASSAPSPAPVEVASSASPSPPRRDSSDVAEPTERDPDSDEASGEMAAVAEVEDPGGHALDAFFHALELAEAHDARGRVGVVQFGDSHTAADEWTGSLRQRLQQRFGDAGRGFVLAGHIHRHAQSDVRAGHSGAWTVRTGLPSAASEPLGLEAVRMIGATHESVAWVSTCATCTVGQTTSRFDVYYRATASGGALEARVDNGAWTSIDTHSRPDDRTDLHVHRIDVVDGDHRLELRPAAHAEVQLFGVALERTVPGVVLDAFGVEGAQALHLEQRDWRGLGAQLARRDPRLVILQFGTNDAANAHLDLGRFEERVATLVQRVRASTPCASVLVLGPPDMNERIAASAAPEAAPSGAPTSLWQTTPRLYDVIAAERSAAASVGAAFFDTFSAMGGNGMMDRLTQQTPRLAYGDHIHLTPRGYTWLAGLEFDALMRRYDAWRAQSARARAAPTCAPSAP